MRRTLIPIGVAALGLLVGAAVSGVPTVVANDVTIDEIVTSASPTTTSSSAPSFTATPTTIRATATTVPPAPTTPRESTTTVSAAPTPSEVQVDPDELRVVVANAGAAPGTATRVAGELRALGFPNVRAVDASVHRLTSVVLYEPTFDAEGRSLAVQRGIEAVEPRGDAVITSGNASADVWVVVGSEVP